jgi:hypothetical protein
MRHIDLLRSLILSTAMIFAFGGAGNASEGDMGETDNPPSVEAAPPVEAPEEAADETTPPAETPELEEAEADEE